MQHGRACGGHDAEAMHPPGVAANGIAEPSLIRWQPIVFPAVEYDLLGTRRSRPIRKITSRSGLRAPDPSGANSTLLSNLCSKPCALS
jgi:hypothetical protein